MHTVGGGDRWDRLDQVVGTLLYAVTIAYLVGMPRYLSPSDEAYYLYHAKRLLQGQVLYRDIFDFIPPLFTDSMALLFHVFGTDMATARIADAILHGAIGLVLYRACRAAGVRRGLAAAAAFAHLAVAQPAWPFASPHWLSTLLVALLLLASLDRRAARGLGRTAIQGLLLGALVDVQQQRGAMMAMGLCVLLLADRVVDNRYGSEVRSSTIARFAVLAAAALAVAGSIVLVHVAQAGIEPIFRSVVLHPFAGYRRVNSSPWGGWTVLSVGSLEYTVRPVLAYLPLVALLGTAQLFAAWMGRRDREHVETLVVLLTFGTFAVLSVSYLPDFIHLAFVAPLFFLLAAAIAEPILVALGRTGGVLGVATAAILLGACTLHLERNQARANAEFAFPYDTAFGRVDFRRQDEVALVQAVRARLRDASTRDLFCYPVYSSLYLMADADDPTPHDLIFPGYQDAKELERVIRTLDERRVRYVALVQPLIGSRDPVAEYVHQHYDCAAPIDIVTLCTRRDDA